MRKTLWRCRYIFLFASSESSGVEQSGRSFTIRRRTRSWGNMRETDAVGADNWGHSDGMFSGAH